MGTRNYRDGLKQCVGNGIDRGTFVGQCERTLELIQETHWRSVTRRAEKRRGKFQSRRRALARFNNKLSRCIRSSASRPEMYAADVTRTHVNPKEQGGFCDSEKLQTRDEPFARIARSRAMPGKAGRELVAKSDPARIPDECFCWLSFAHTKEKYFTREREGPLVRAREKSVVAAESLHF